MRRKRNIVQLSCLACLLYFSNPSTNLLADSFRSYSLNQPDSSHPLHHVLPPPVGGVLEILQGLEVEREADDAGSRRRSESATWGLELIDPSFKPHGLSIQAKPVPSSLRDEIQGSIASLPAVERAFDDRPWLEFSHMIPTKIATILETKDRKAVPEPTSLLLILTGWVGLLARRRLRRSAI